MATADPKVIEQCRAAITRSAFNPNAPRYLVDALRAAYAELTGKPAPSAPCIEHATCRAYAAAEQRMQRDATIRRHAWPQCNAQVEDGRCVKKQGHAGECA